MRERFEGLRVRCGPDEARRKNDFGVIGNNRGKSCGLNRCDNAYCPSVCGMYAVKESLIAKEHVDGDFQPSVFYMGMRTYSKDFVKYHNRAKSEGVRFLRVRVHTVEEIGYAEGIIHDTV